jgi:hypothetical protein
VLQLAPFFAAPTVFKTETPPEAKPVESDMTATNVSVLFKGSVIEYEPLPLLYEEVGMLKMRWLPKD